MLPPPLPSHPSARTPMVLRANHPILKAKKDNWRHKTKNDQNKKLKDEDKKRPKTDDNWVRNISSCPLETKAYVMSHGRWRLNGYHPSLLYPVLRRLLSRQRDLSESAKDNITGGIALTIQSASIPDNNSTKEEEQALKRLTKKRQQHCYTNQPTKKRYDNIR